MYINGYKARTRPALAFRALLFGIQNTGLTYFLMTGKKKTFQFKIYMIFISILNIKISNI